mmetsp:Transcript_6414/g.20546  ORF Transcript_6414/g.20546 Transcript_6414/m.20546 type:complete len:572 (+) Transcript_6414:327-2042(+)
MTPSQAWTWKACGAGVAVLGRWSGRKKPCRICACESQRKHLTTLHVSSPQDIKASTTAECDAGSAKMRRSKHSWAIAVVDAEKTSPAKGASVNAAGTTVSAKGPKACLALARAPTLKSFCFAVLNSARPEGPSERRSAMVTRPNCANAVATSAVTWPAPKAASMTAKTCAFTDSRAGSCKSDRQGSCNSDRDVFSLDKGPIKSSFAPVSSTRKSFNCAPSSACSCRRLETPHAAKPEMRWSRLSEDRKAERPPSPLADGNAAADPVGDAAGDACLDDWRDDGVHFAKESTIFDRDPIATTRAPAPSRRSFKVSACTESSATVQIPSLAKGSTSFPSCSAWRKSTSSSSACCGGSAGSAGGGGGSTCATSPVSAASRDRILRRGPSSTARLPSALRSSASSCSRCKSVEMEEMPASRKVGSKASRPAQVRSCCKVAVQGSNAGPGGDSSAGASAAEASASSPASMRRRRERGPTAKSLAPSPSFRRRKSSKDKSFNCAAETMPQARNAGSNRRKLPVSSHSENAGSNSDASPSDASASDSLWASSSTSRLCFAARRVVDLASKSGKAERNFD